MPKTTIAGVVRPRPRRSRTAPSQLRTNLNQGRRERLALGERDWVVILEGFFFCVRFNGFTITGSAPVPFAVAKRPAVLVF
jgi:hypothetical protein